MSILTLKHKSVLFYFNVEVTTTTTTTNANASNNINHDANNLGGHSHAGGRVPGVPGTQRRRQGRAWS